MTAGQRDRSNVEMRCIALPGEDEGAMLVDDALAGGPHEHSKWVVARESVRPVWYDWMLPSKHGTLYFYQRLLLRTPWRDSTPESQLIIAQLQRCSTLSPTARHLALDLMFMILFLMDEKDPGLRVSVKKSA